MVIRDDDNPRIACSQDPMILAVLAASWITGGTVGMWSLRVWLDGLLGFGVV